MSTWRTGKLIFAVLLIVILTSTSPLQPASAPAGSLALPKQSSLQPARAAPEHVTLFSDNFNTLSSDWNITENTWSIVSETHNKVLEGNGHAWATLNQGDHWTDYTFTVRVSSLPTARCS